MELKHYETVFILTPILSDEQAKDTVEKFKKVLTDGGAEILNEDNWGLRKLAYPIQKKSNGFYTVIEFKASGTLIKTLETEYRRDEKVMRHIVVSLDQHAVAYLEKRKKKSLESPKQDV
jgi:small subunit ribosomal protein S6